MADADIRYEVIQVKSISRPDKEGHCTVVGTPEYKGGWSKFPTTHRYVQNDEIEKYGIEDGHEATLKLQKGRLKDDAAGDTDTDHWWNVLAIRSGRVSGKDAPASRQEATRATQGSPRGQGAGNADERAYWDAKDARKERSIQRQVAVKAVTDLVVAGKVVFGAFIESADAIAYWIGQQPEATPVPSDGAFDKPEDYQGQGGEPEGDPEPSDVRQERQEGEGSPQGEPGF